MARRPEQPAKARIDALAFEAAAFGTVPGAAAAASRTAGWTEQTQTQIARVGAEVADLEVACRTVKELDAQASTGTDHGGGPPRRRRHRLNARRRTTMAGSFAEARAQILSLRPEQLRTKAERAAPVRHRRPAGRIAAGRVRRRGRVAARGPVRGVPGAGHADRVLAARPARPRPPAPPVGWTARPGPADRARMVLAQQEQVLAALAADPAAAGVRCRRPRRQALAALNEAIAEVTQAYGAIAPPAPGTAPVVVAAAGGGAGPAAVGRWARRRRPGRAPRRHRVAGPSMRRPRVWAAQRRRVGRARRSGRRAGRSPGSSRTRSAGT